MTFLHDLQLSLLNKFIIDGITVELLKQTLTLDIMQTLGDLNPNYLTIP